MKFSTDAEGGGANTAPRRPARYVVTVVTRDRKPWLFGVWDHKREGWIDSSRDEILMDRLADRLNDLNRRDT